MIFIDISINKAQGTEGSRLLRVDIFHQLREDILSCRLALEAASVKIVAQSATEETLRSLDRFRHFDPSEYPGGFISYNRAFHRALTELSGNARLMRATWDLIDQMDRVVTVSVNAIKRRDPGKLIRQHCDIIDALQARERRKAERMVRLHVSQAEKRVCDALSRLLVVA